MHSHAAHTRRFRYAVLLGRGGSPARHRVKLLMTALMMLGMATQVQAVVERVAPASSQLICFSSFCNDNGTYFDGTPPFPFSKKYTFDSAQAWCSFATWTYSDRAPEGRFLAFYTCGNFGFALFSASCPIPTNNPGARYTLNPSSGMCEREVQQYTIALHNLNLGGELATLASRAAYAQVMEGATAKSGIAVTLTTSAPPGAGTAILSPTAGSTGADGRLNFTFTAPPVGGTHTVTATCDGGRCSNQASGTVVVTACPVPDLPPITDTEVQLFEDNPDRSDETHLTEAMKEALRLLKAAASTAGSTSTVGSAYRPPAYNQHLIDVWKKWDELTNGENSANPTCVSLKTKIQRHFQQHKLLKTQPPVPNSRHTRGEAVDVTISPEISNIDALARDCCNNDLSGRCGIFRRGGQINSKRLRWVLGA